MSIDSKFNQWAKSPEGRAKISGKMEEYYKKGISRTKSGDDIVSEKRIAIAASKFRRCLESAARDAGLPDSVMAHILSMDYNPKPIYVGDGFEILFLFGGDLHRDSLEDGSDYYNGAFGGHTGSVRTGETGIENIIALFNNGAKAQDYTYGWWNGHKATGDASFRSASPEGDFAWVRSKKDRAPLHFIQQAIDDFNGNYGSELNMTAVAAEVYKK